MHKKIPILTGILMLPIAALAAPGQGDYFGLPEHRVERLSKELSLSADQQKKLQAIMQDQQEKFRAILEESHQRIKKVLSAEQISKWEAMKNRRQENQSKNNPDSVTVNP